MSRVNLSIDEIHLTPPPVTVRSSAPNATPSNNSVSSVPLVITEPTAAIEYLDECAADFVELEDQNYQAPLPPPPLMIEEPLLQNEEETTLSLLEREMAMFDEAPMLDPQVPQKATGEDHHEAQLRRVRHQEKYFIPLGVKGVMPEDEEQACADLEEPHVDRVHPVNVVENNPNDPLLAAVKRLGAL